MKPEWWWDDMRRCFERIAKSPNSVELFMNTCGHPTFIPGVGCIPVGVYTKKVSIEQLMEDVEEADRVRRRKVA
jgi:hypothetical protein